MNDRINSAQHTPGPWIVGPVDDTVVTHLGADGCRYEVAAIDGDYNDPDTWPIMEANARLIAAAPELYEALAETWRVLDAAGLLNLSNGVQLGQTAWYVKARDAEALARAALAKAGGAS